MAALEPRILAAYVREIARAFGLDMVVAADPRNERQAKALVADLRARLRQVSPVASAASIGEVLDALAASDGTGGTARRVRKLLAELDDLVGAGTYARTKRAERGRLFALVLLVFELSALVGVEIDAADPETSVKLVRRARR